MPPGTHVSKDVKFETRQAFWSKKDASWGWSGRKYPVCCHWSYYLCLSSKAAESKSTNTRSWRTIESRVGRPPVVINMEDVELLHCFHFTWYQITDILEVSRSTLYRRIQDEGLSLDLTFTNIIDSELDHHVEAIKRLYPNDGERLMIGYLRSLGIYVPRSHLSTG